MTPEILTVALNERTYDIFFGEGIYPLFQEWICRFYPDGPVFVVTDRNVADIYGEDIRHWLTGMPHFLHVIRPGEESKNWETVREIYAFLAAGDADRDSLVVAFGGGVVGDLAGFAAATYLRGIPCIQVPTTLLAQVDSSVGGKTGFNLKEGKNLVGSFHQPRAVFIDHAFLRTLDDRNLRAGFAEVVKSGLAGDAGLWSILAARAGDWKEMSGEEWRTIIRRSVAFKAAVVEKDERESSTRRILNLGHTLGHAFEQASGYGKWLHGEAVAMGLAWETFFSWRAGVTAKETAESVIDLLAKTGYALDDPEVPLLSLASAIGKDKKRVRESVTMPMVASPGNCVLKTVQVSLLRKELPAIRELIRPRMPAEKGEMTVGRDLASMTGEMSPENALASLEERVTARPKDTEGLLLLSEAYRRSGNIVHAWETVKEALQQSQSDQRAQRLAREIEGELTNIRAIEADAPSSPLEDVVLLDEGAFEIRPVESEAGVAAGREEAEAAPEPAAKESPDGEQAPLQVRTITMAGVYWEQGERETAMRIVDEILTMDPSDSRALAWKMERFRLAGGKGPDALEGQLAEFLGKIAKEYAYELS